MSGKIYTMKEMKGIVEYLTEHKAYGDVKGRKMWMDFANSSLTSRSWQSLKETFLKRILPDIHNPYYGLTREQIFSFRQGYDVQERNQNKLEIEPVGEESNSNGENPTNIEEHLVSSADNGEQQGEANKCAQVTTKSRSSQDSPDPQTCYNTVDDIRRDLESPKVIEETRRKSLNLEKVPPIIQNVINDFNSDSEDANKIDTDTSIIEIKDTESEENKPEDIVDTTTNNDAEILDVDAEDNDKELDAGEVETNGEINTDAIQDKDKDGINASNEQNVEEPSQNSDTENDITKDQDNPKEAEVEKQSANEDLNVKDVSRDILEATTSHDKSDTLTSDNKNENQKSDKKSLTDNSQNLTNTNSGNVLPNNQEGLDDKSKIQNETNNPEKGNDTSVESPRKRGSSVDTIVLEKRHNSISEPSTSKQNGAMEVDESESEEDDQIDDPEIVDVGDSTDVEAGLTTPLADDSTKPNSTKADVTSIENPCLKSVSLFAEQFNKTKYSDSSCDQDKKKEVPKPKGSKRAKNVSSKTSDDVVVLKSHSESDSNEEPQEKKPRVSDRMTRSQREKAFANVFGFSHGGTTSNRNRKSSRSRGRRPTNTRKNAERHSNEKRRSNEQKRYVESNDSESESSGWSSNSEQSNYVHPPRGKRNRHTKKYLKPPSLRILSLEENGGLFVMYGKKVYPVMKDGGIVKSYVIYESNSDSGFDQESFWKAKYAQLKKKYQENIKIKEETERERESRQSSVPKEPSSPILPSKTRRPPPTPQKQDVQIPSTSKADSNLDQRVSVPTCPVESNNKITIKYIVNNAEVQLEGHWPQICPIFDKVVTILPNKTESQKNEPKVKEVEEPQVEQPKVIVLSGESTPVNGREEAAARVEKLESEIFKEIAEKDNEEEKDIAEMQKEEKQTNGIEQTDQTERTEQQLEQNINASPRKRGRKPKRALAMQQKNSPRKQPKLTEKESTPLENDESSTSENQANIAESSTPKSPNVIAKRTRRSLKAGAEKIGEPKQPNDTQQLKQGNVKNSDKDEEKVKYMLPPTSMKTTRSSIRTPTNSRVPKPRSLVDQGATQSDEALEMSESTQGYQDSDTSLLNLKRKKKVKLPTITYRNKLQLKRNGKKRSQPYLLHEMSSNSSSSSVEPQRYNKTSQNTSEIYKSESYQNLFPQTKISKPLEPIRETSPIPEIEMRSIDSQIGNPINVDIMETDIDRDNVMVSNTDGGSSSNVSLPQSPELSIVEDISIGKNFINSIREHHSLKNIEGYDVQMQAEESKYIITDVDITLPLMEQICKLQGSVTNRAKGNTSQRQKKPSVSESLISKICTVNINDNSSVSDSLDMQLRDLLLESAKKMSRVSQIKENMEVDENELISKRKKRCSTPRKRKEIRKSLISTSEATVEQHMETCSYGGRKSCPPSIQVYDENAVDCGEITLAVPQVAIEKTKGRKKKDVIKVKILRPRNKSSSSDKREKLAQRNSKLSICTDSGINGTASGTSFPTSNDSVELIHNHSETCLQANECVDSSVEFVNVSTSIISLTNSISNDWQDTREMKDLENMSLSLLNNNNKGFILPCNNGECTENITNDIKSDTIYRSPPYTEGLNNSLITEDLSDGSPAKSQVPPLPSRWYLLSEDETTNSNFAALQVSNTGGFGSNLNQIFPITCAVPDLSTITEISRENDSRKPTFGLDSFTRDSNSQNIFM